MTDNYQVYSDAVEQSGRVVFVSAPRQQEWDDLQLYLLNLLEKGYLEWTFDLEAVQVFSSVALGKLLTLHVSVKKYSAEPSKAMM